MERTLELVGGPPASGKSTYIAKQYKDVDTRQFRHLDFDAMVVKEARTCLNNTPNEVRDEASRVYGNLRSDAFWSQVLRVTVDWPFSNPKRAMEYINFGRSTGRRIECNFFTVHATEAWKRSLTRHVAGEYNAFTVFYAHEADVATALKPSYKMFLEAHRDMPSSIEQIFPLADEARLWDNNARDSKPVLIARCKLGEVIEILEPGRWNRFQYKRDVNVDAEYEVTGTRIEVVNGKERQLFEVDYKGLINPGKERAEYAMRF
jgi:predicted ABC-type ATPase